MDLTEGRKEKRDAYQQTPNPTWLMHRFGRCPVLGPKPRNGKRAALTSHLVNRRNVVQRGRRGVNITSRRVRVFDWNFFIETLTAPAAPSVHVCTLNTIFLPALQPGTIQRGCLFIVAKSKLRRRCRRHHKFRAFRDGLSRDYKSLLKGRGMKNEVGKVKFTPISERCRVTPSNYFLSVGATHTRD